MKNNRKLFIIVLTALFVVFTAVTLFFVLSDDYTRTVDKYEYYQTEMGQRFADSNDIMLAKEAVDSYNMKIGIVAVLAGASLVGDIVTIIVTKPKKEQ